LHHWNSAYVTSLRRLIARGLASNGRMYWPAVGMTLTSTTGRLASATQNTYMTTCKTMLDAINVAAQAYQNGLRIHVLGYSAKTGASMSSMVTSIRGEQRMDSIERRENQQPPVWSSALLA